MAARFAPSVLTRSSADDLASEAREAALVASLCGGSEAAFKRLVEEHHGEMVRVAARFVCGQAAAEDVVQDVWMVVVRRIGTFEGRCSLKTWIFRILTNRAKTAGQREGRHVGVPVAPTIDWAGREPVSVRDESVPMEHEMGIVRDAIRRLPPTQRHVITLRDIEGRGAREVCALLGLSEGNERVLLHRARTRVRQLLQAGRDREESDDVA